MTKRAAIYARYSTELQSQASIEDQIRICTAQLERDGWLVAGTYSDYAISGATTLRPGFQALLRDACQIASNPDPHFASNSDPLIGWDCGVQRCYRDDGGAVGKWRAGATAESLAQACHLSAAVRDVIVAEPAVSCGS